MADAKYKLAIVAGEQSGQLLASDLIKALNEALDSNIDLVGVGGTELQELGLNTLFDPDEIALTGITSVLASLPKLLKRIRQTADAIIDAKPDCLLLVDSPEFSLRVAKRVKAALPNLSVVKYVSPQVWAWRPGRAVKMRKYIDHILAILPFEPELMERLNGPKTHYVGHRLMMDEDLQAAWKNNQHRVRKHAEPINILVLPGSRSGEVKLHLEPFAKTIAELIARGHDLNVSIPTLPRHQQKIIDETWGWPIEPKITTDRESQMAAFKGADVALAASGTVTLELALAGVPVLSCYRMDPLMRLAVPFVPTWTGVLPNLIVDQPIVREYYNQYVRPPMLARHIEQLTQADDTARRSVMNGYANVRELMKIDISPSEKAASIILDVLRQK